VGCCKTPKCTFAARSGWWWYRLAEKWLKPQNSPKIRCFCPLGTPKKASVNFYDHHCKGNVFTNIHLYRKCVSNVFGLGSVAYWMGTVRFSSLCKTRFCSEMSSQWRHGWARSISKCAGKSYRSNDNIGDRLAHSVQKFWSLIVLPATVVARAEVNVIGAVWFHVIIQLVRDGFQLVFIQQVYTKLNNAKSTRPIDLKFSGKRHFHAKNIHLKFANDQAY